MVRLADSSISPPSIEFEFSFTRFGSFDRPAYEFRCVVLAANKRDALRILKRRYPRSDKHILVRRDLPLLTAA